MFKYQINQDNCNSIQVFLPLDFEVSFDKDIAKSCISRTIHEVVEGVNIFKYVNFKNRNVRGYNPVCMFKAVLLAFALDGYASVRKLEDSCRHDIRFRFLMNGETPSHMSFQRFIHDDLKMGIEEIFYEINQYIEKQVQIDTDVLYIDGTKFEANANKNSFVWMKSTRKNIDKTWGKCISCIERINREIDTHQFSVLKEPNVEYLFQIGTILEEISEERNIKFVYGKGKRKSNLQRLYEKIKEYTLKMMKYQIHKDIAGSRNSFSKTDPDATFMHMKYDYYNNTGVFKPGYNVQFGVSDGYIRVLYISGDANDQKTLIPTVDKYINYYGTSPQTVVADAGYSSYDNYYYLVSKGIENCIKPTMYETKKITGKKRNRYKKINFEKRDGYYYCPEGHQFKTVSVSKDKRSKFERYNELQETGKCIECPFKSDCTKSKGERRITRNSFLDKEEDRIGGLLEIDRGKLLMRNRSIQAEGVFADIKEDRKYTRLRRRGESNITTEIYLVAIGHNLRKYHKQKNKIKDNLMS